MSNPASHLAEPPSLARRLTLILGALQRAAAARAAKDWSLAPAVLLLWSYLNRLAARFEALAGRAVAGNLSASRVRPPADRPQRARRPALPQGFGWLLRRVPDSIHTRSQLHHLLSGTEMAALLATAPQAARLLRPLCRMLGIGPDPDLPPTLFLPKVAQRSPVQASAVKKPPAPAVSPAPTAENPRLTEAVVPADCLAPA